MNSIERCIDDEIPFEIPDSWEWVRLETLCWSISDGDHQPPPQVKDGIPFLVISDVSQGKLTFDGTRSVPKWYFDKLQEMRKPQVNDILFTVTGSFGIVIPVNTSTDFCFQRHIALLKPTPLLNNSFLCTNLTSPLVYDQCKRKATGTAQKTVGLQVLRHLLIPLPPLAEQKRIVAEIERLFSFQRTMRRS